MREKIDSKYQVKGTAIKNARNYIVSQTSQEFFEELAQKNGFENANLILPSSWYPVELLVVLQELASAEVGWSLRKFTLDATMFTIEQDLLGIYKFFMRVSGASNVLSKLPQMSKAYANFLGLDILENRDTFFVTQIQLPIEIYEWWIPSYEGAVRAILKVCNREFVSIQESDQVQFTEGQEDLIKLICTAQYK